MATNKRTRNASQKAEENPDPMVSPKSHIVHPGKPRIPVFEDVNPFREVNWRWRRAQQIIKDGEPISAKTDDIWTRRAANYVKASSSCSSRRPNAAALRTMRDITVAQQLAEEEEIRWAVEAELLSGEPITDVARKAGVEPSAITAFESLFFHVLDRLECSAYIRHKVLGKKFICDLLTLDDKDILLKMFGYYGGPIILKHVSPYIMNPTLDISLLSPLHRELGPKIRRLLAILTTRFTWPTDAKSKQLMEESEPATAEQIEEMIHDAIAKGKTVLHPVKREAKSSRVELAKSSESDSVLKSLACGGGL